VESRRWHFDRLRKLGDHLLHRHPTWARQVECLTADLAWTHGRALDTGQEIVDVDGMAKIVAASDVEEPPLAQRAQ